MNYKIIQHPSSFFLGSSSTIAILALGPRDFALPFFGFDDSFANNFLVNSKNNSWTPFPDLADVPITCAPTDDAYEFTSCCSTYLH